MTPGRLVLLQCKRRGWLVRCRCLRGGTGHRLTTCTSTSASRHGNGRHLRAMIARGRGGLRLSIVSTGIGRAADFAQRFASLAIDLLPCMPVMAHQRRRPQARGGGARGNGGKGRGGS